MMNRKRYETKEDLVREKMAIEEFVGIFGGTYMKLGPNDIDFRVHNRKGELIGYAEVKGRKRPIRDAYPLPVAARKLVKLCDKQLVPIIIWACEDGIIYGRVNEITGSAEWGGRSEIRRYEHKDKELMVYYPQQPKLKEIKY